MSRIGKALVLAVVALFVLSGVYTTLYRGTTDGPDFIEAVQAGSISPEMISSLEIVEPTVGHMPFTTEEYDSLPRRLKIDSSATMSRFLFHLAELKPGRISLNHPGTSYRAYVKVNVRDGFYWLYCQVLQDNKRSVLLIDANTRNATNPNGASEYQVQSYSELLAILEGSRLNETDVPATWTRPVPPWEPKSVGQRFKQFLQKAVPWSVLPFLICIWIGMTYVIAQVGGWTELASIYGTSKPMPPTSTHGASAGMRAMINYRSCLRVGADEQGIYLVPSFQFRAFHPPLFVPWAEVTHVDDKFWFKRVVRFRFSRGPRIDLWIDPAPAARLLAFRPETAGDSHDV